MVCRDDSSLNFNIDLYTPNKGLKLVENQTTAIEATNKTSTTSYIDAAGDLKEPKSKGFEILFVIKMHLANETDKIFSYLVSSMTIL